CLEGAIAVEFAKHGARVLGIEGREDSVQRANFTAGALRLSNLSFVQDDVRNLSPERYGRFDVVLCLGLLYHLDAAGVVTLVHQLRHVASRVAFIETHVSLKPNVT